MVRSCKILSLVLVVLSLTSAKREIDEAFTDDEMQPKHVRHPKTQVRTQAYVSSLLQTDEDIQGFTPAPISWEQEMVVNEQGSPNSMSTSFTPPAADGHDFGGSTTGAEQASTDFRSFGSSAPQPTSLLDDVTKLLTPQKAKPVVKAGEGFIQEASFTPAPVIPEKELVVNDAVPAFIVETFGNDTWSTHFIGSTQADDPSTTQTDDPSAEPLADPLSPSSLMGLSSPGLKKHVRSSDFLGGIHSWARILVYISAASALLVSLWTSWVVPGLADRGGLADGWILREWTTVTSPAKWKSTTTSIYFQGRDSYVYSADNVQKEGRNTYAVTRDVLWRYLGFIFLLSFVYRAWGVRNQYGADGLFNFPSIDRSPWFQFWGGINENSIFFSAWLGVVLSMAMLFWQCKTALIPLGLFVLEVSFVNWSKHPEIHELMKCEYLFLALALYPIWHGSGKDHEPEDKVASWTCKWTSFVALWLLRFNTFRIVFEAGLSKVEKLNLDPCWNDLTCAKLLYNIVCPDSPWCFLNFNLPEAFLTAQTMVSHFAELSSIWFVFCTHRHIRHAAAVFGIAFQAAIWLTGHFGVTSIVTAAGFLACFDDAFLKSFARFFSGTWFENEGSQVGEVETMGMHRRGLRRAFSFCHMGVAAIVGIVFVKNSFTSLETMAYSGFEKYEPDDAQWHVGTATYRQYSVFEHFYRRKISTAFEMQHGPGTPWTPLNLDCSASEGCFDFFRIPNPGNEPTAADTVRQDNWSLPGSSDHGEYLKLAKLGEVRQSMLKNRRISRSVKHALEKVLTGDVTWASTLGTPLEEIFSNGQAPTAIRWKLVQYRIGTWSHLWNTGKTSMSDELGEPFGMLEAMGPRPKLFVSRWPQYEWLLTVLVWQVFLAACAAFGQKIHGPGPTSLFVLLSTLQMLPNILTIPQEWIFGKSVVGVLAIYGFLRMLQGQQGPLALALQESERRATRTETLCSSKAWRYAVLVLSTSSLVLVNRHLYVDASVINFVGCIGAALTAMIPQNKESKTFAPWGLMWPREEEASLVTAVIATFASVGCCTAIAAYFPGAVANLSVSHLQS